MGARINGIGTNTITIDGAERLKGVDHTILSDHMEVGSLIGAAGMTHGEITIKNAVPQYLRMTRLVFQRLGVETEVRGEDLFVKGSERYKIEHDLGGAIPKVQSQVWPGFPSDLTSIATAMATQAEGTVLIHEWMFPPACIGSARWRAWERVLCSATRTASWWSARRSCTAARSAAPISARAWRFSRATLCAKGKSVMNNVEQIDRGYEDLDGRLRALGAKIERAA